MSKSLFVRSIVIGFIGGIALYGVLVPQTINADLNNTFSSSNPSTLIKNGHLTICKLDQSQLEVVSEREMMVTAYTNIEALTDDSPNTTASNKQVKYGMVATNLFKFGTKVRIPELYGDKIFIVEDRMNRKYDDKPHLDVFLPTYKEAKEFGAKVLTIQVLES